VGNNTVANYDFVDKNSLPTNFYRLQLVDAGGNIKYSNIEKVVFDKQETINIYPNPAVNNFVVSIKSSMDEDATIHISDISGKTMSVTQVQLHAGLNTIPGKSFKLLPGLYTIQIKKTSGEVTEKLLIQKN
jgi:hypothetical protein